MKFEIKNRFSGNVIFTAEIECSENAGYSVKLGLAIKSAVKAKAALRGADLRDADLRDADLRGADLRDAVLRGAVLSGAVLSDAALRDADLSGADLRGVILSDAVLSGVPVIENIHQKVYEAASQPGALEMSDWYTCGTTHCRAGWVTTLAGEEGKALDDKLGTAAAATLIYLKSDPAIERIPDFYCSNDEALADMKRLAELATH